MPLLLFLRKAGQEEWGVKCQDRDLCDCDRTRGKQGSFREKPQAPAGVRRQSQVLECPCGWQGAVKPSPDGLSGWGALSSWQRQSKPHLLPKEVGGLKPLCSSEVLPKRLSTRHSARWGFMITHSGAGGWTKGPEAHLPPLTASSCVGDIHKSEDVAFFPKTIVTLDNSICSRACSRIACVPCDL